MAHSLFPPSGQHLHAPQAALARLRAEFLYVVADRERAYNEVGDAVVRLIQLRAPQHLIDLTIADQADAIWVTLADSAHDDRKLQLTLRKNQAPMVGYASYDEE